MYLLIILSVAITAVSGLVAKYIVQRMSETQSITWSEYAIVMVIIAFVVAPGSVWFSWQEAKKNLVTFHEFYNGWELQAHKEEIECQRDGSCRHEYDCDPYLVSYSCNCDDKGNCQTCLRTEYHSCPYVNWETNYYVSTTIGEFLIDDHRFPDNPQSHRWRAGKQIPNTVIQEAGSGKPPFWIAAKRRIDAGNPDPVTKRMPYENYIYASDQSLLKQYSAEIEKFEKRGWLPKFQSSVFGYYYSEKVYFVGFKPENQKDWFLRISNLNAALGRLLEGDLHLVFVKNNEIVSDPDIYALALKAYWQNTKVHGKDAMSKNAIVVVCLTDEKIITWARSFTGMPLGNERLTVAIDDRLRGKDFRPEIIIGNLRGELRGRRVENVYGDGILENLIFGLSDTATRFHRISMTGKDANDNGSGFLYLLSEIQPTFKQQAFILLAVFFICCIGWIIAIVVGDRTDHYRQGFRFRR